MTIKAKIVDLDNQPKGEIDLNEAVFGVPVRKDILARVINWQLAKRRAGTASTKEIGDIRGRSKKPYAQKGTGNARQGSLRSPQFRGGAVIFGPKPRDYGFKLPKKVRALGLKTALSTKQSEGKLIVLDAAVLAAGKPKTPAKKGGGIGATSALRAKLAGLGANNALIIGGATIDGAFARAARNIPNLDVIPIQGANVYDIIRRDTLVLTQDAVKALEARLA